MRFHHLDLNLLVALDALLTDQSITRAAERLHLSQSAMSGALARLREHFHDELLAQVGRKMVPTALGESLRTSVRNVLLQIQSTIEQRSAFDPDTSERRFSLMSSDYVTATIMTDVVRRTSQLAPGVTFELLTQDDSAVESLDRGDIDFVVLPRDHALADHPSLELLNERYACVVSSDHHDLGESLSFDDYLRMGHVIVRAGRTRIPAFDEWFLSRFGFARRIEVVTTSFSAVPPFLVGTQRIAMMPERLARHYAALLPLKLLPPPIDIPPLTEVLQWHRVQDKDPAIIWLRELIGEVAAAPV
ncbi:LysR family transcriptional regulator [Povalibacter sp.]|uniref:LysR family transcriptional regulator n=1 Tax=Povalibacter sp. TaxID=1962978 RepID=UPI002F3E9040